MHRMYVSSFSFDEEMDDDGMMDTNTTRKRRMLAPVGFVVVAAAAAAHLVGHASAFTTSTVTTRAVAFRPASSGYFMSSTDATSTSSRSIEAIDDEDSPPAQTQAADDFSFFDEASIYVRAGSGGQGSSTYKKAKKGANGIPDGGSGGLGGNVVLVLDPSLNTLAGLSRRALRPNAFGGGGAAASSKRLGHGGRQGGTGGEEGTGGGNGSDAGRSNTTRERLLSFRAENGKPGGRMYDNGRGGEDCEVRVPPGTVVSVETQKEQTGDEDDDDDDDAFEPAAAATDDGGGDGAPDTPNTVEIGTVSYENPMLIVAKGGAGGEGTATLKGKKKGATRRGPGGGERHRLRLTLKIVADVALVGKPNAGKSTFLAAVTRAKPRIADYPFTTVVPNLGTWIPGEHKNNGNEKEDRAAGSTGLVLCDVPGLIAGASEGVGLGHAFLRHIERCRVILHLIDATADDPVGDLNMVNDEIQRYGTGSLAKKPQVVIVNKMDAAWIDLDEEVREEKKLELANNLKAAMGHTRLMWVSAKERDGVDELMTRMASYVGNIKQDS